MLAAVRTQAQGLARFAPTVASTGRMSLFSAASSRQNSLEEEFDGTPAVSPAPLPQRQTRTTTLENGVKVVSENVSRGVATIGLVVPAGSRYENARNNGISHVLSQTAFKDNTHQSAGRRLRELEDSGATVASSTNREYVDFRVEIARPYLSIAVQQLHRNAEGMLYQRPYFQEYMDAVQYASSKTERRAGFVVSEALHAAAFRDYTPLGLPLACPRHNARSLTADQLEAFAQARMQPAGLVLVGVGVDHDELVSEAAASFGKLAGQGAPSAAPASEYYGGEVRIHCDAASTHIALAFKTAGSDSKDLAAAQVLRELLGGTRGVEMRYEQSSPSRLGVKLSGGDLPATASSYLAAYKGVGLLGCFAECAPDSADSVARTVMQAMSELASSAVPSDELQRAKQHVKVDAALARESRTGAYQAAVSELVATGAVASLADVFARVDAVTAEDVKRVAAAALARPSLASLGRISRVPYLADLVAKA